MYSTTVVVTDMIQATNTWEAEEDELPKPKTKNKEGEWLQYCSRKYKIRFDNLGIQKIEQPREKENLPSSVAGTNLYELAEYLIHRHTEDTTHESCRVC